MTALVQELLSTFDGLSESERREIVLEILKRVVDLDFPSLPEEDLVWNAEAVFLELDKQESPYD